MYLNFWKVVMSGATNSVAIGHRATRTENSVSFSLGPPYNTAHFFKYSLFHKDNYGSDFVCVSARIESVCQDLAHQSVRVQAGKQLIDEVRMPRLHRVLDDVFHFLDQFFMSTWSLFQCKIKGLHQFLWLDEFQHFVSAIGAIKNGIFQYHIQAFFHEYFMV